MPHTGQCLCGDVRLSITSDPISARSCWCKHCQKFSGGNGTTNVFFHEDAVSFDGEVTWFEGTADSGNTTLRAFCPRCGSHVFTRGSGNPEIWGVRIAMLDDPDLAAPTAIIWTDSAPKWAVFDPELRQFPKAPAPRK